MANLISPFGNARGTGNFDAYQEALKAHEKHVAEANKKIPEEDEEIIVSVVSELRPSSDGYDPLFEAHINIGREKAFADIIDAIEVVYNNTDLSKKEIIESISRSFILTRQADGRYVKSDLIMYMRKYMLGKGYELTDYDGETCDTLDHFFETLTQDSKEVEECEDDEPDINDCRDITLDPGFGKFN